MSTTTLPTGLQPGTYAIDASHSEAGFSVRHAMVARVRGTFHEVQGTVVVDEDHSLSKVEATIVVASIDTRNADRDNHLRSADFFDTETYPAATFRSTAVRPGGDGFVVDGELEMHGTTKPLTLEVAFEGAATDPFGNQRAGFSSEFRINRKDFGLTWNATLETGGVLVSDEVTINLDISTIRQQA